MNRIRAKLVITQQQLSNRQEYLGNDVPPIPVIRAQPISNDKKEESTNRVCLQLQKIVESFKSDLLMNNIEQLSQVRDRKVNISIPTVQKETAKNEDRQIERWLTKVCSQTFSIAFQQYRSGTMNFSQSKIFCSENILRNIALLSKQKPLKPDSFELMDKHIKNGVLRYMMTKYPLSESTNINKKLNSIIKQVDNYQKNEYDFFSTSSLVFQLRESGNYNDLIMKTINSKLKQIDDVQPQENLTEEYGWSNYKRFENYFTNLFQKVEDQEWMNKKQVEFGFGTITRGDVFHRKRLSGDINQLTEGMTNFAFYEDQKKKLTKKERHELQEKERQAKVQKKKYREKVKQYTTFLIGRKINENVLSYTQKDIDSLHLVIKHPSILRILTKWCEELWNKFQAKDYFLNNHEQGLKVQRGGNFNTLSLQLKQSLGKLMQEERIKIEAFMAEIGKNNYEMQESLLKKELENEDQCTFMDPLEKACGVFSVKVVNNLHNYIITYLNRLIHGLLSVSDRWFSLNRNVLKAQVWPSPPNLLTLRIGDMMRCKCESRQNEIINLYRNIVKQSRQNPEQLKIIRVKNRLKQSTNDILINIQLFQKFICQIQLSVQSQKSHFIEHSNQFCHYLYELQRSVFGPITEICSIWCSLDQRKAIYQQFLSSSSNENYEGHLCEDNHTAKFLPFQRPFICSLCKVAYSHNYYITKHVKCEHCNYWRCARCQLQLLSKQQILQNIVEEGQLMANCTKVTKSSLKGASALPEYGFCIFQCSKIPKVQLFNLIPLKNKTYLFGLKENKVYEISEIYNPKKYVQFMNNYLIFSLPPEIGRKWIKIDKMKANHEYLLVKYRNQIFQKERESMLLQEQQLTDQSCQLIFNQQAKEKQNISYIDLEENHLTSVRTICSEFPNLKVLQLNSNSIEDYTGISELHHLEQLNIGHYPLREGVFPEEICKLSKLTILNIQDINLEVLPESMSALSSLKKIEMGSNKLKKIPDFISCLTKLEYLSAFSNRLEEVTPQIGALSCLKTLILSDNNLSAIPSTISLLERLVKLDLQSNSLSTLSFSCSNLRQLQQLDLSKNSLSSISDDLGWLSQLRTLNLSQNSLTAIPSTLRWRELSILDLKHNKLQKLPESFYGCLNLIKIQLSHNNLQELDEKIACLKLLQSFSIANNLLETCPEGVSSLENLCFLNVSSNRIRNLVQHIGNLSKLQILYASGNRIESIPTNIRRCISLKQLYLNDNAIAHVPEQLASLNSIEQDHLDLSENPIEKISCPEYLLKKGDYMTKELVRKTLSIENQQQVSNPQDLQRMKEAIRRKSLRRRGESGVLPLLDRRSISHRK